MRRYFDWTNILVVLFAVCSLAVLSWAYLMAQDAPSPTAPKIFLRFQASQDGRAYFTVRPEALFEAQVMAGTVPEQGTVECTLHSAPGTYVIACDDVRLVVTDWFLSVYTGEEPGHGQIAELRLR